MLVQRGIRKGECWCGTSLLLLLLLLLLLGWCQASKCLPKVQQSIFDAQYDAGCRFVLDAAARLVQKH
jgi:hypothetical protein